MQQPQSTIQVAHADGTHIDNNIVRYLKTSTTAGDHIVAFAGNTQHQINAQSGGIARAIYQWLSKTSRNLATQLTTNYTKADNQGTNQAVLLSMQNTSDTAYQLIAMAANKPKTHGKPTTDDWQSLYNTLYSTFRLALDIQSNPFKRMAQKTLIMGLPGIGVYGYSGPKVVHLAKFALDNATKDANGTEALTKSLKVLVTHFQPKHYWRDVRLAILGGLGAAASGTAITLNLVTSIAQFSGPLVLGLSIASTVIGVFMALRFSFTAYKTHWKPGQHKAIGRALAQAAQNQEQRNNNLSKYEAINTVSAKVAYESACTASTAVSKPNPALVVSEHGADVHNMTVTPEQKHT